MIAFRITLNGQHLATAGLQDEHVLNAIVNSVAGVSAAGDALQHVWMHLGGLIRGAVSRDGRHVSWLEGGRLDLSVGDQLSIEVVEVEAADPPIEA